MEKREENRKDFGNMGEEFAVRHLREEGYEILNRNYRVGRMGEIDIIARDGEYICFVEVKTRTNAAYGAPCEAVTKRKQKSIIRLAKYYFRQLGFGHFSARFDIIEVTVAKKGDVLEAREVNLIKNAFYEGASC